MKYGVKYGVKYGMKTGKRCAIALGFALFLASCSSEPVAEAPATGSPESSNPSETVASAPTEPAPPVAKVDAPLASEPIAETIETTPYPERGQLTSLQMGDLMCYTTLVDPQGQMFDIGATFEICDRQAELLNQNAIFTYSVENVADCQSAEPCGRTRQETLISDVIVLGEAWEVWSNGTWTVTVGQIDSWDGTNNTGGLTYYGCDDQGNCLALDEGFTVCRNGICNMSWENGDYAYTLSSELSETGDGQTTLLVYQNGNEILRADNMEIIDASDFQ